MRIARVSTLLLAAALFASERAADAQVFQGLGFIAGGGASRAIGVNGDGSVVVGYGAASPAGDKAFRWTSGGGMVSLGTLGGTNSQASEVSDDGSVVVGYSDTPGTGGVRAFRWTQTDSMVSLGTLTGGTFSYGNGVSGDGRVVVGYGNSSTGSHAYRWTQADGMVDLGVLNGFNNSLATGTNTDGSVVVGYCNPPGSPRPFRWEAGAMDNLGNVPGWNNAYGYACSADGSVVVGRAFDVAMNSGQIFRWTATDGIEGLGTLPGDTSAFAYGVSGDGSIIVGMSQVSGAQRAFIWTRSNGMVDLNTYLPTLGADLGQWVLTNAMDISTDGSTIVGYGVHNGATEAWAAHLGTPCPADIGAAGGVPGRDGQLDNNDFIAFITYFFDQDPLADRGVAGGLPGSDGLFDNNDFIAFISQFFAGC